MNTGGVKDYIYLYYSSLSHFILVLIKSINKGYSPQYKKGYFHNGGLIQSFDTGGVPGTYEYYYNPQYKPGGDIQISKYNTQAGKAASSGLSMGQYMGMASAAIMIGTFIFNMLKKKPKEKPQDPMSKYYVRPHEGGFITSLPRLHTGLSPEEFPAILQKGERVLSRKQDNMFKEFQSNVKNIQENRQTERKQEIKQENTFVIQAMDSKSFAQFLNENKNSLANSLVSLKKDNHSFRHG